jgi:hypothetical protein
MIGCGGSGQKSVRYVRDAVRRRLMHAGWQGEFPKAWQFIGIDTLTTQEDPNIPFLPAVDYVSVSLNFQVYSALNNAINAKFPKGSDGFKELMGWRANPAEVVVPLTEGAGQLRAVGRAAGVLSLQSGVLDRLKKAFSDCAAGGPQLAEVSQLLGVNVPPGTPTPAPLTLVVGSLAGGTGAGIMLDVIDLIRRTNDSGQFPILVGFTPDIFGNIQTDMMTANSVAFMAELMSAYWDNEHADGALIPTAVNVGTRGPSSTFLIGRKNLDGLDLGDSKNVYRAVGEALAAVTTDGIVQTTFNSFIKGNWPVAAPANQGGYGFHAKYLDGVVSSFGSTTLSIGRDRFREYLEKLLHRSIVEYLSNGFESAAVTHFGEGVARTMAGEAKISELARRFQAEFTAACGLQEQGSANQVSDYFVSNEYMKAEYQAIVNHIKQAFTPGQQMSAASWAQIINARSQEARAESQKRADDETLLRQKEWSSAIYQRVLTTCTDFAARFSFPVVLRLIELVRNEALEVSAEMRQEAKLARASADQVRDKARVHLAKDVKGNVAVTAGPVQETINDTAKSIGWEWAGRVRDQVAVALESVGTSMLTSIEAGLRQALGQLNTVVTPQDGKPAVVSTWPQNDNSIPSSFTPSPVEFYLESHETWPQRAKELLERSLGSNRETLPSDPVHAARVLIIRGGYSESKDTVVNPLIWADSSGSAMPRWSVGEAATVTVDDSIDKINQRIESWLMRPSTEVSRFLNEGLRQYLQVKDELTGVPIADHSQRLATFKQRLQEALNQSRPLIEIDTYMYSTVHPKSLEISLNVQGFPFGEGHPARPIVRDVIQGFMKTPNDVDWAFSSSEAESVLLSSFIDYPVHPAVVTSFTQPLQTAIGKIGSEGLLQSSFWQWRRARILENFIPLPDELRRAAIRGFAVGRSLGYVTATIDEQNRIITPDGERRFPEWLLTPTNQDNILASLLESMVLTFADAPTLGKAAFDAYAALIDLGEPGQSSVAFTVKGDLKDYLVDGKLNLAPVDPYRKQLLANAHDIESRRDVLTNYLTANVNRFDELEKRPLEATHWREKTGYINPVDTLSLELLKDLKDSYTAVLNAVKSFTPGGGVS